MYSPLRDGLLGIAIMVAMAPVTFAQSLPPRPAADPSQTATVDEGPVTEDPAATAPELPKLESVLAQIEAVESDASLDETAKERLLATLRGIAEGLRNLESERGRQATLDQVVQSTPERLAKTRQSLESELPEPRLPSEATDENTRLSIDLFRQRRAEAEAAVNTARQEQQNLEATQRERLSRATALPMLIADARNAADAASAVVVGELENDPQGVLRAAREGERLVNIALTRQRLATLIAEQALIDAEVELLPLQIEEAREKTRLAEISLKLWADALGAQKQYRIETELADYRDRRDQRGLSDDTSTVLSFGERWLEVVGGNSDVQRSLADQRSRFEELDTTFKQVTAEIDRDLATAEGLRSGLGLKLLRIRSRLPSGTKLRREIREVDDAIEKTRRLQTEIDLALDELHDRELGGLILDRGSRPTAASGSIEAQEVNLLLRMKADTDEQINDLIELKGLLELKRRLVTNLRSKIESNVIWIRDATTLRPTHLPAAWGAFKRMIAIDGWVSAPSIFVDAAGRRVDLIGVWILFACVPWALGRRLRHRLSSLNRSAPFVIRYPIWASLRSLLITLILAIPPSVTLAVVGSVLLESPDQDSLMLALGTSMRVAALVILPMRWLRQIVRTDGVAQTHFRYSPEQTRPAFAALGRMVVVSAPLIILWGLASDATIAQGDDTLARLIFVFGMSALAYISWHAFHPEKGIKAKSLRENPDGWLARFSWLWHGFTIIPLVLAGVALFGYTYAATLLVERLYWSLWFAVALIVVGGMLARWVQVRRTVRMRSDVLATAAATLPGQSAESGGSPPSPGVGAEQKSDADQSLAEIDAQTLRLLGALLWVAILVGVAWLWAPVLPAVRFLDRVPLWDTTAIDGSVVTITLANLVMALPIAFLTWVAARNVPGLVESTLLEKLPLDRPARYAITSLASYAIIIIGVVWTAQAIGLRWEGIQWLVAALGVGLGFGLQEIFANFISGLILLFEQPIRVGDVVTIGDTTGTVSKIRIRATIVTNWDRQELIIPNKNLITERLINWTLSDTTNRIELRIGVAYGTDTRIACRLLEEICNQQENVLVDPKPVVTFEAFGASTLNLTVRCFLGRLDQRLDTLHDLNTTIDERFKQAGIEIAFPQQDLHIRSFPSGWTPGPGAMPLATRAEPETAERKRGE
jgi:potassium efflux system protein